MTQYAAQERRALTDLLDEVGPHAPTLCEGWTTLDLAVHLVVRERRPDAAAGLVVPALAGHLAAVSRSLSARVPWPRLVSTVRRGPPLLWHPVDELFNTTELFVHHEDVRRAGPGDAPRRLDPGFERALWGCVRRTGRLVRRRVPCGLVLSAPGYGRVTVRAGEPSVTAEGSPGELLLFATGRQEAAQVALSGEPQAVEQVRRAPLGF